MTQTIKNVGIGFDNNMLLVKWVNKNLNALQQDNNYELYIYYKC